MIAVRCVVLALSLAAVMAWRSQAPTPLSAPAADEATARAVRYLAREVPRWRAEEGCYSCHNNGDAARALMAAAAPDSGTITKALADTFAWLAQPDAWNRAVVNRGVDNKILARIQFGAALADAVVRGSAPKTALAEAATMIAADQEADGSWRVDTGGNVGSPVTYGTALATAMASRTITAAGRDSDFDVLSRAYTWLARAPLRAVPDAAGVLLGLPATNDLPDLRAARRRAAEKLLAGQDTNGGWGPFPTVAAEPFDTAIAILALQTTPVTADRDRAIAAARAWLRSKQHPDGSWPETTRPAGQQSYAQAISTAAWALLALTENK